MSGVSLASILKNLGNSANIFNQHTEQTHMSEVDCFPFASLNDCNFQAEMSHYLQRRGVGEQMAQSDNIKDPEPYLPGQVHGLEGTHGSLGEFVLFEAFKKNGITNCTVDYGSEETMPDGDDPQHELCRGYPPIWPNDAPLQTPMLTSGGYDFETEPWIPLWQIDAHRAWTNWKPINLQRYTVSCMQVISPVLPLTQESYQEVDHVADIICQTLRVQREDGPGIQVRCESRTNFKWSSTQHRVPENLKQTLEKRFSRVQQVDQEKRLAYAHEMFNELVSTGPQPRES